VRIWEDNIIGMKVLLGRENLALLKMWMERKNLHTLYNILEWDDPSGIWKGQSIGFLREPISPLVSSLFQDLSGCTPLNISKKARRGLN